MSTTINSRISLKDMFKVVKSSFINYFYVWTAYKAMIFAFILVSVIFAFLPIFLGRFIGGENYAQFFEANGGGRHPEAFILLGTNTWMLLSFALWDYVTYIREEQQSGTLESLFLTPANQVLIIMGRGALSAILAMITFVIGLFVGLLLLDINLLFSIDLGLFIVAIIVILLGFIPLLGLSLASGAIVLHYKEVYNIVGSMQMFFGVLIGVFFPITLLPIIIQVLSLLFPGTWIVQDVRYIIAGSPPMLVVYGLENVFGNFPIVFDTIILLFLTGLWAIGGWYLFSRMLRNLKREEGLTQY